MARVDRAPLACGTPPVLITTVPGGPGVPSDVPRARAQPGARLRRDRGHNHEAGRSTTSGQVGAAHAGK
eukprot:6285313-Pyramimonas_sp.AAC.1